MTREQTYLFAERIAEAIRNEIGDDKLNTNELMAVLAVFCGVSLAALTPDKEESWYNLVREEKTQADEIYCDSLRREL